MLRPQWQKMCGVIRAGDYVHEHDRSAAQFFRYGASRQIVKPARPASPSALLNQRASEAKSSANEESKTCWLGAGNGGIIHLALMVLAMLEIIPGCSGFLRCLQVRSAWAALLHAPDLWMPSTALQVRCCDRFVSKEQACCNRGPKPAPICRMPIFTKRLLIMQLWPPARLCGIHCMSNHAVLAGVWKWLDLLGVRTCPPARAGNLQSEAEASGFRSNDPWLGWNRYTPAAFHGCE